MTTLVYPRLTISRSGVIYVQSYAAVTRCELASPRDAKMQHRDTVRERSIDEVYLP